MPQVIERTGRGLFNQSEEVVEAAHAKYDIFWRRYKVLDVESESHGEALLNCLNDFNTKKYLIINKHTFPNFVWGLMRHFPILAGDSCAIQ